MTGITLNTTFNNASLPSDASFKKQILGIVGIRNWFQADANHAVLVNSNIQSLTDLTPNLGTMTTTQAFKPKLTGNSISGYSAMKMVDGGSTAASTLTLSKRLSHTTPFTVFAMVRCNNLARSGQTMLAQWDNPSKGIDVTFYPSKVQVKLWGVKRDFAVKEGEWVWVAFSFDGVNKISTYSSIDKGITSTTVTPADIPIDFTVGGLYSFGSKQPATDSELADLLVFDADIIGTASSAIIENYFSSVYGVV